MILVFGKNGQVATALKKDFSSMEAEKQIVFLDIDEANFLTPDVVIEKLNEINPTLVINASAYTLVDKAESEQAVALQINALTPGKIAEWCKSKRVPLIHFSTDYVFRGDGTNPWTESMTTEAVNYYGETKLQSEKIIKNSGATAFIFRISWVYAPWGKNFPKTILKLAQERDELSVVEDQIGSPTDAREVSAFIKLTLNSEKNSLVLRPGIYHLRFKPFISWFEIAKATIEEARSMGYPIKVKNLKSIPSIAFPTPARRPLNSRLDTEFPEIKKFTQQVIEIAKIKKWSYLR